MVPPIIVEPPVPVREESSAAMEALAITLGTAGALLADDATVIGVLDDPAIPVVLVVGAVVVGCLLLAEALSDGTEDLYDPANADHDRNPAADKKLSKGEIDMLKDRGFNIHSLKGKHGKRLGEIDLRMQKGTSISNLLVEKVQANQRLSTSRTFKQCVPIKLNWICES